MPNLVDDGLPILQYADDTVIFMDHNIQQVNNMTLLLCVFANLSGLKINFEKSEIFCFEETKYFETQYSNYLVAKWDPCHLSTWSFQ